MKLKSLVYSPLLLIFLLFISSCEQQEQPENPKLDKLTLQPGFVAEHLFSPSENDMGSWVSMAFDDKGRIIASDQYGSLYRIEVAPIGSTEAPKVERLKFDIEGADDSVLKMGHAQGLLWAFNSLYVMINNREDEEFPKQSGLYRLQDLNNNDQFDKITLIRPLKGNGEHGPHSVILSPDEKSLYVISGNHTDAPEMDAYRLPKVWQHDNLFPALTDPRGHASSRLAPGGWIAKIDPEGKHWELISAGYRNPFDIAFNQQGDLFTYDSDMEWDLGMPWYRPTRICHVTSGSEYGWRTGNGKWSPAYPDNLPPILNIGQGSPTGVIHGKSAKFPSAYKDVVFAFDWSFGIIYAIHLKPEGSTYTGTKEEFLSGIPLPLTDGVIGPDGAMYFMTGGRRLSSDLYRVYYGDTESLDDSYTAPAETPEHKLRVELEQYHGEPQEGAVDFAWQHLNNEDRFIQYAARIAVEHQPVSKWKTKVLQEKDPVRLIQGSLALTRQGDEKNQTSILNALLGINYNGLTINQQIDLARAIELNLARFGKPQRNLTAKINDFLSPQYPSDNDVLNFELSKILAFIEAPGVIEKTLTLLESETKGDASGMTNNATEGSDLILRNLRYGMSIAKTLKNMPPAQHTFYGMVLSELETGWTPELRERYFSWFKTALGFQAGNSYIGYINNARKTALTHVPEDRLAYYNELSGDDLLNERGIGIAEAVSAKGPGKNWKIEDASQISELSKRNPIQGKNMFIAANCILCHSVDGNGGSSGPELSQLGTRFSVEDILSSIVEPSKVISDQYASSILVLKNGQSIVGRIVNETDELYEVSQNPFDPDNTRKVPASEVVRVDESKVSAMPPGTINALNEEELKDLMAYLISGGNPESPVYK